MEKSRFSEEQIIGILMQHEAGVKRPDLCREHGISGATFYAWKSKHGGMDVAEPLVADLSLADELRQRQTENNGRQTTRQGNRIVRPSNEDLGSNKGVGVYSRSG